MRRATKQFEAIERQLSAAAPNQVHGLSGMSLQDKALKPINLAFSEPGPEPKTKGSQQ